MSVQPNGAVHIDAIKLYAVAFLAVEGLQVEGLPIPPHPSGKVAYAASTGIVTKVLALDAPVVRHIEVSPPLVIERRCLRVLDITQMEAPSCIHIRHFARLGGDAHHR